MALTKCQVSYLAGDGPSINGAVRVMTMMAANDVLPGQSSFEGSITLQVAFRLIRVFIALQSSFHTRRSKFETRAIHRKCQRQG